MSWIGVSNWTEERVERCLALWKEGRSAGQIADLLGNVTRNAVLGKLSRLGQLGSAATPRAARPRDVKPRIERGGAARCAPRLPAAAIAEAVERIERELPDTDDPFSPKGCRWPVGEVGEANFRFCQRARAGAAHSSWCAEHHAFGHQR